MQERESLEPPQSFSVPSEKGNTPPSPEVVRSKENRSAVDILKDIKESERTFDPFRTRMFEIMDTLEEKGQKREEPSSAEKKFLKEYLPHAVKEARKYLGLCEELEKSDKKYRLFTMGNPRAKAAERILEIEVIMKEGMLVESIMPREAEGKDGIATPIQEGGENKK